MREMIEDYLSNGKQLTLLKGKRPLLDEWVETEVDKKRLLNHDGNLGWVLGYEDIVIDVDPKNGGYQSFIELSEDLNLGWTQEDIATVNTPSGGFHIYMTIPDESVGGSFKKTLKREYPGIDFLTRGSQCVIPGSKTRQGEYEWADDMLDGFIQFPCPQAIIDLISYKANIKVADGNQDAWQEVLDGKESGVKLPEDRVLDLLTKLDNNMPNDEWVKVGMALHDWDEIDGLRLFEEWSIGGHTYEEGETAKRWAGFRKGQGVSFGTIMYLAQEADFNERESKLEDLVKLISKADKKMLKVDLPKKIKKMKFDKLSREEIVKAMMDRHNVLTGVKPSVGSMRALIAPVDISTGTFVLDEKKPDWCKDWVHINSHNCYMNIKNHTIHKSESFNNINGKFVPLSDGNSKMSAVKYVADRGYVDNVEGMVYMPNISDTVFKMNGMWMANSFSARTIPEEAEEYTEEGLRAIEKVIKHIAVMFDNQKHERFFTQWIAHQIQYPGRKILYAPFIQSIEGIGKSLLGGLLRACLGPQNVGTVSPSQITSQFNGWAQGVLVNLLEEVRIRGHNRYDGLNAVKPLITDNYIQINEKGVKAYTTYNCTNYLCFTNHKDALPLGETDRRWWVIFIKYQTIEQFCEALGESKNTYFTDLFDSIQKNAPEIRKFFLEYEISERFMEIKQAPMTIYKKMMVSTDDNLLEGLSEARVMLDEGGPMYNNKVVATSEFFRDLEIRFPDIVLNNYDKNQIMKRMQFSKMPNPIKFGGKPFTVWTKTALSNRMIRHYLKYGDMVDDDL